MPVPVPDALLDAGSAAATKATAVRTSPARYLVQSALAGAYVGIAVVLLLSVAGPLAATGNAATKLVAGAVFGIALTLVVFAGAELFTGNAMVMVQGWWSRRVKPADVGRVWVVSLLGNLVGSLTFAAVVHGTGILAGAPSGAMLAKTIAGKVALTGPQLLWRSVLCNLLVCVGLWMASRTKSDAAKLAVLWWALLAFIASGFEHSVANMTTFALAALNGTGTWGMLARNLVWTVPGNLVGGAVVVGAVYAYLGRTTAPAISVTDDVVLGSAAPTNGPTSTSAAPVPVAGR
jgi:nitrite transporter NirC